MTSRRTLNKNKILDQDRCPTRWPEVIAAYEQELYRTGRAEPTVATYASAMRVFGNYYREQLGKPGPYVGRLQETDIRAFMDHLRLDRLLKPSSLNRFVAAWRSFAAFLVAKQWHRRDLGKHFQTYRVDLQEDPPILTKNELRRLVTSIDTNGRNGLRDLAILQLFLQCGLRVGELARLSRDDAILHKTIGRMRVRSDKSRTEHVIPLNTTARTALQNYVDSRGPVSGSEPLFVSERKQGISVKSVQHVVKKYLCFAGRGDLSAHDLRHHFAATFYHRCGKLTATQAVLGHRNVNTTARYARASAKEIEETLMDLDR